MAQVFESFVLLAEMRTGSNFLEENLNAFRDLKCWGEAFNPHFVGQAGRTEMAGVTLRQREARPLDLLEAIRRGTDGLSGFRFFHDHDPRILRHCLKDRKCAKIILTRDYLDSYVSLKIARQTGQWRLRDSGKARSAKIRFDKEEYAAFVAERRSFSDHLRRDLQMRGQVPFHFDYVDIGDIDILNGLARFLGVSSRIEALPARTRVQNPFSLRDKVENCDEMITIVNSRLSDGADLAPSFEPARGANVPGFVLSEAVPLIFQPIRCAPDRSVRTWLDAFGGTLVTGMSQRDLRQWKRRHPGHRSFTVVRHPVARAHTAFCRHILTAGPEGYTQIRETLRRHHDLPIPEAAPGPDYDLPAHRRAFLAFLTFVRRNLGGQTGLRVDGAWATQSEILRGMGQVQIPDRVYREDEIATELPRLAESLGSPGFPYPEGLSPEGPHGLDMVVDDEIEGLVREIYQRDYMTFGYGSYAQTLSGREDGLR